MDKKTAFEKGLDLIKDVQNRNLKILDLGDIPITKEELSGLYSKIKDLSGIKFLNLAYNGAPFPNMVTRENIPQQIKEIEGLEINYDNDKFRFRASQNPRGVFSNISPLTPSEQAQVAQNSRKSPKSITQVGNIRPPFRLGQ